MHHLLQCLGPRLHLRRAPFNPCWRRRPLAHREPKSRPASPRGGRKMTDGANTRDRECSRSTYNREKLVEKRGKPERRVTEQSRIHLVASRAALPSPHAATPAVQRSPRRQPAHVLRRPCSRIPDQTASRISRLPELAHHRLDLDPKQRLWHGLNFRDGS